MQLLISDANIIIDMDTCDLTRTLFRLPETFATPNVLYEEELMAQHADLPGLGMRVLDIEEEYMKEAYRLRGVYPNPGHNDLLALSLAKQEQCPLLTGDGDLRSAAEQENIEVKGTIWVIGRFLDEGLVRVDRAEEAYDSMKQEQRRLPWAEAKKQIIKYRK